VRDREIEPHPDEVAHRFGDHRISGRIFVLPIPKDFLLGNPALNRLAYVFVISEVGFRLFFGFLFLGCRLITIIIIII
jgi:hypothetical protein